MLATIGATVRIWDGAITDRATASWQWTTSARLSSTDARQPVPESAFFMDRWSWLSSGEIPRHCLLKYLLIPPGAARVRCHLRARGGAGPGRPPWLKPAAVRSWQGRSPTTARLRAGHPPKASEGPCTRSSISRPRPWLRSRRRRPIISTPSRAYFLLSTSARLSIRLVGASGPSV